MVKKNDKNVFTICFWRHRAKAHILSVAVLASPSQYTVQRDIYSHQCELSGRVTLTGHRTYAQSLKYIICVCFKALPGKRFIHALVWRVLFLSLYTWKHARALKSLSNSAWLLNYVIFWANTVKTHK